MTVKMTYDAKAKEIVIRVPFDEKGEYPDSASGKTQAVATTRTARHLSRAAPTRSCGST